MEHFRFKFGNCRELDLAVQTADSATTLESKGQAVFRMSNIG